MEANRWKLTSMRDGFADSLKEAKDKLSELLGDSRSTKEQREAQQNIVSDLTDRLERATAEIEAFDKAAEAADKAKKTAAGAINSESAEKDKVTQAYASLIRATVNKQPITQEVRNALKDDTSTTGGSSFLPKTVSTQIITEPFVKNPLRDHSTYTSIENLEIPKMSFTLSDDGFIEDGDTAKELAATGSTVAFGRNKFKVFCDVSETVLRGSDADLTAYVNRGLESGLAAKEKKVAFALAPAAGEEHMSFYAESVGIKVIESNTLLSAIRMAIADLEDDFLENAQVCMRRADYLELVESLANGSATLYTAPPESILGIPAFFCDKAMYPVIGDFTYSHFNYAPEMGYDTDKDVKTGLNSFVLTAWFDHQIKLASAFRIAKPADAEPELGYLNVTSAAGSASGKTAITVSPAKGAGNTYKYKTNASAAPSVTYGQNVSSWTTWDGTSDITATTGHKITVVEADSGNHVLKAGSAVVTSAT